MDRKNEQRLPRAVAQSFQIPFKLPYDWKLLVGFLQPRAIPGLEVVTDESYKRVFKIGASTGLLEVRPSVEEDCLTLILPPVPGPDVNRIQAKLTRLFDTNADPKPISDHLSKQPPLTNLVALHPGIRVPGAFDGFEIAVRAVLGQQITVRAATTMAGRLVAAFGTEIRKARPPELSRLFPASAALAEADLPRIGLTRAKARAIAGLARAHLSYPSLFEPSQNPRETMARLIEIPGIGEWTVQYIAMRALKYPDGFPASDLGLLRAVSSEGDLFSSKDLEERSRAWRPWRAYAAMHLWATLG